jgi:hypothetical protein
VCEYGLDEPNFSWDQDKECVYVTIPNIPKGLRGHDMNVKITRDTLLAGIKGQDPAVQGNLRYKCSLDDSTWGLDTDDNKLEITLVKVKKKRKKSKKRTIRRLTSVSFLSLVACAPGSRILALAVGGRQGN